MYQTSPFFVGGEPGDDVLVCLHNSFYHMYVYTVSLTIPHPHTLTPHTITTSHPCTLAATPSPGQSRKQTSLQHKRGSLHLMKKDGKEDPSTFVIREGTHARTHTHTHTHARTQRTHTHTLKAYMTFFAHLTCVSTHTPLTIVPMLSTNSESASPIH